MIRIIQSGRKSAKELMKIDEKLLEELQSDDHPIIHFYRFQEKAATFGHFLNPQDYIDLEKAKAWGLDISKRPTGGGVIFHIWDLPFSVLIPASHSGYFQDPLKNYAFVNRIVLSAIEGFLKGSSPLNLLPEEIDPIDLHSKGFCMAKPTKYDIMFEGRKIAGAAQRRKKQGYLHQGSISLSMPNFDELSLILHPGTKVLDAMKLHTTSLLGQIDDLNILREAQEKLDWHLEESFKRLTFSYNQLNSD
jgi:lipoate-protein ligase A